MNQPIKNDGLNWLHKHVELENTKLNSQLAIRYILHYIVFGY